MPLCWRQTCSGECSPRLPHHVGLPLTLLFLKFLSQLSHRHIISFRGMCSDPDNLCIVMEFASKGTLLDVLKDSSVEIGPERVVEWAVQLASGMDYLHTGAPKQIIHRDLKSGNILVSFLPSFFFLFFSSFFSFFSSFEL